MRNVLVATICCLLIVITTGCLTGPPIPPQQVPKITTSPLFSPEVYNRIGVYVIDRTSFNLREGSIRQVEDEFMRAVIEKGYILAARSDIDQIRKELKIQSSDFSEAALARKAKAINISAILLVSINDINTYSHQPYALYTNGRPYLWFIGSANISARLISAELAQVVWISSFNGSYRISDLKRGAEVLVPVAQVVASGLPSR